MLPGSRASVCLAAIAAVAWGGSAGVRPPAAPEPAPPAAGVAGERLFVLQKVSEVLATWDPATGERRGRVVRASPIPHEMAATADGGELYVTNYGVATFRDPEPGADTLTVVDVRRMATAGVVDIGPNRRPHGIARGRSGRFYVTTDAPPALLVVDPAKRAVVARYPIAQKLPHMVAVTPDERRAVVANSGSGTLSVVPIAEPVATAKPRQVTIGGTPMGMAITADGRWLYATNRDGNQIAVVDLTSEKVARTIAVAGEPARLAFADGERKLVVSAIAGGAVVVVDAATGAELARVPVGARPEGLLVDEAGGRLFVSVQDDDKVVELGLGDWMPRREIKTGGHPDALWLSRIPAAAASGSDDEGSALLAPDRLAARSEAERAAWKAYLERSARLGATDRKLVDGELAAAGRSVPTPAPYLKAFKVEKSMTPAWFAGGEGRRVAENMVSFQTPSGGWSKHVDFTIHARRPGESFYSENEGWHYIATLDNDSTTEELRFLDGAFAATGNRALRAAFGRGIDYLLAAQLPNGCWPQVYPLQGGYHDAVTFNDDALINVMRVLDDVASGRLAAAPATARKSAAAAAARGLGCIVAAQVVVGGTRAIWGQQHDPLTLAPAAGRRYELAGLAGRESSRVVQYLMGLPAPSPEVVEAVHAAAAWFRAHAVQGLEYDVKTGPRAVPGAPPTWGRLYDIETGRPMFANRDGIKRFDWNQLGDRRFGYAWYSRDPAKTLAEYDAWSKKHPRK